MRIDRAVGNAREQGDEPAGDIADESVDDERREEQLNEAAADSALLNDVRGALTRIDNGTFGQCVVDGGPIEEKRLEAVPWTPYCVKHAQQLDRPGSGEASTL